MPVNNRFCLAVLGLRNVSFSDGWIGWRTRGKNPFRNRVVQKRPSPQSLGFRIDDRSTPYGCPGTETVSPVQNATGQELWHLDGRHDIVWHQSDWKWRTANGCGGGGGHRLEVPTSLRQVSRIEGVSTLVLFGIAMPLKYFAGMPRGVTVVGSIHGALFVGLVAMFVVAVGRVPISLRVALTGCWPRCFPSGRSGSTATWRGQRWNLRRKPTRSRRTVKF
ncbi:MAG: hypothetical protein Ct9H300mP1_19420 [Planctomycetaceae bacterium]|nr:MAG: hypothetical protein Ct9H300mP1_19420 [Planctomycetaceae bacterium]